MSKKVESSTYGSDLVASRIAVEMLTALRYQLTMLGCKVEDTSLMVGDNMAVILNTTVFSSSIKKKHQSCNYHKVRESIAAKFVRFQHIKSEDNLADLLTKPLPRALFDKLTAQYLFRRPKTVTGPNTDKGQTEESIK